MTAPLPALYDMIHPNASDTLTVRSVFVVGPDKKVKLKLEYPASTGRNFDEVLRVIDSLQLTANHQVATPVNWKNGEDVIIVPAVTNEQAKENSPMAGTKCGPICASSSSRAPEFQPREPISERALRGPFFWTRPNRKACIFCRSPWSVRASGGENCGAASGDAAGPREQVPG